MAMYTKMTSTGSSLIVNPRTISKELEAKIAASIAGVIAKHDVSKLTTKLVRQAVEKDVHVSLTNHKEVLKRLMHQEFRKVKAQKVAKRVVPEPWKNQMRRQAMQKAMTYLYRILRGSEAFASVGLHAIQTLYDLQTVESGEVLRLAALYIRMLGAIWLKEERHSDWTSGTIPTPAQLVSVMGSVYTIERVGICHDRRVELLEFFDSGSAVYQVEDFLGWNPAIGPPPSDATMSSFERMTNALVICHYARTLSIALGTSFMQLLQHMHSFYPYKGPDQLSDKEYRYQVHLVSTLVMVLTNYGSLRCELELLPHEYYFLRHHLVYHLARQDVALVGETLRALRCFEGSDNLVQVRRGMAFLLLSQQEDGSWKNSVDGDYRQEYFATINGLLALSEPKKMGFAPSIPEVTPLLELHLNADIPIEAVPISKPASKEPKVTVPATSSVATTSIANDPILQTPAPTSTNEEEPIAGGEEEDLATRVRFLQGMLEESGADLKSVSSAMATHVLSTLSGLKLNVEILKSTGIGRVINKLRKHGNAEVAQTATQLVAKWKKDLL